MAQHCWKPHHGCWKSAKENTREVPGVWRCMCQLLFRWERVGHEQSKVAWVKGQGDCGSQVPSHTAELDTCWACNKWSPFPPFLLKIKILPAPFCSHPGLGVGRQSPCEPSWLLCFPDTIPTATQGPRPGSWHPPAGPALQQSRPPGALQSTHTCRPRRRTSVTARSLESGRPEDAPGEGAWGQTPSGAQQVTVEAGSQSQVRG